MKLKLSSIAAAAVLTVALIGCGSDSDDNKSTAKASSDKSRLAYVNAMGVSFEKDMTALTSAWTSADEEESTAITAFKALSNAHATATLIQGSLDIASEVGDGKIGDPLGGGTVDTTKVESQFSWNSSADFYNNIHSIEKVWDTGLSYLSEKAGADTAKVTTSLAAALNAIKLISDLNTDKVIAGTAVISQENAFRNVLTTNNASIVTAQAAVQALATDLEEVQKIIISSAGVIALNADSASKTKIDSIADDVIKATYIKLGANAGKLKTAISALKKDTTPANVTAARVAWKAVRAPWESSEAYIVTTSPSLGAATDGNTDSWPVTSQAAIESNLKAWDGDTYTIVTTDGETKGFHTIEYMLFGDGKNVETAEEAVIRLKK
ncbi:MAG: hypothetical protein HRT40_09205 [Campylobacteraceae bacterium]|nr:hypothetical protein [Campylobacteraceae bacterium]